MVERAGGGVRRVGDEGPGSDQGGAGQEGLKEYQRFCYFIKEAQHSQGSANCTQGYPT